MGKRLIRTYEIIYGWSKDNMDMTRVYYFIYWDLKYINFNYEKYRFVI